MTEPTGSPDPRHRTEAGARERHAPEPILPPRRRGARGRHGAGLAGTTERVSVASDGAQGDAGSFVSAVSADGRFVAFNSIAGNLVPGDTNGRGCRRRPACG